MDGHVSPFSQVPVMNPLHTSSLRFDHLSDQTLKKNANIDRVQTVLYFLYHSTLDSSLYSLCIVFTFYMI